VGPEVLQPQALTEVILYLAPLLLLVAAAEAVQMLLHILGEMVVLVVALHHKAVAVLAV
jgi:hypothetical protein